jgi:4-amino-4-deoxy-L-arabinose transferase-like glycosyltransferase
VRSLPWNSRLFVAALFIAIAAYAALVVAQERTRKPWNDEAMSASAGYTLATKGYLAIPSFDENDPSLRGIHRRMYYILPLQMIVMGGWYKLVGFSLFRTRLLSTLWTAVLFCALYRLIKTLAGDPWVALLAVGLTAFDYQVTSAAALGRYDTMVAALGFSAYALFLLLRERRFTLAVLASNTCIAAACLTHPNGVVYFLGLWFLILYYDRGRIRIGNLALAAIPYLLAGGAWGWYILQDIPSFKSQLFGNTGHRVGLFHPWQTIKDEIELRWIRPYGLGWHAPGSMTPLVKLKAVALLGYLAGIVGCVATPAIRRHPGYRVLLFLAAIHFAYFTFYEGMKFNYYLIHLLPLYLSLLAVFLHFIWLHRPALRMVAAATAAALVAVGIGGILMRVRVDDMHSSYEPAVAFIKQNAGPNDMILASCSLGFGYGFGPNLVDDGSFGYFSGWRPRFIVMEEIYDDYVNLHRTQPALNDHYVALMSGYRAVYDRAGYRIYERISGGTQKVSASRQ